MATGVETLGLFPDPAETLSVLEDAMSRSPVSATRRVFATDDSRSIDEGLAILKCYIAILDRRVRQAILDTLVASTDVDPHA